MKYEPRVWLSLACRIINLLLVKILSHGFPISYTENVQCQCMPTVFVPVIEWSINGSTPKAVSKTPGPKLSAVFKVIHYMTYWNLNALSLFTKY